MPFIYLSPLALMVIAKPKNLLDLSLSPSLSKQKQNKNKKSRNGNGTKPTAGGSEEAMEHNTCSVLHDKKRHMQEQNNG